MRPLNRNDWLPGPHLLMIDEPQRSYKHISLWNGLVKFIGPGFGIYVVLFISYGALAGYGIPEPRDPFTFIQSNALGSSRSQTQIFLLSSLVKRKTTYLPAYAEKRNYQTAQSLGHHKHHFKTSPKSIVQWFGIRESKCELVDKHPYQGSRVDSPTSTHHRVHRFYTSLH